MRNGGHLHVALLTGLNGLNGNARITRLVSDLHGADSYDFDPLRAFSHEADGPCC